MHANQPPREVWSAVNSCRVLFWEAVADDSVLGPESARALSPARLMGQYADELHAQTGYLVSVEAWAARDKDELLAMARDRAGSFNVTNGVLLAISEFGIAVIVDHGIGDLFTTLPIFSETWQRLWHGSPSTRTSSQRNGSRTRKIWALGLGLFLQLSRHPLATTSSIPSALRRRNASDVEASGSIPAGEISVSAVVSGVVSKDLIKSMRGWRDTFSSHSSVAICLLAEIASRAAETFPDALGSPVVVMTDLRRFLSMRHRSALGNYVGHTFIGNLKNDASLVQMTQQFESALRGGEALLRATAVQVGSQLPLIVSSNRKPRIRKPRIFHKGGSHTLSMLSCSSYTLSKELSPTEAGIPVSGLASFAAPPLERVLAVHIVRDANNYYLTMSYRGPAESAAKVAQMFKTLVDETSLSASTTSEAPTDEVIARVAD